MPRRDGRGAHVTRERDAGRRSDRTRARCSLRTARAPFTPARRERRRRPRAARLRRARAHRRHRRPRASRANAATFRSDRSGTARASAVRRNERRAPPRTASAPEAGAADEAAAASIGDGGGGRRVRGRRARRSDGARTPRRSRAAFADRRGSVRRGSAAIARERAPARSIATPRDRRRANGSYDASATRLVVRPHRPRLRALKRCQRAAAGRQLLRVSRQGSTVAAGRSRERPRARGRRVHGRARESRGARSTRCATRARAPPDHAIDVLKRTRDRAGGVGGRRAAGWPPESRLGPSRRRNRSAQDCARACE